MAISVFDLYSIGIGPSSSHTVGPMRAAFDFASQLNQQQLTATHRISIDLYGSLGATGKGHGSDTAVILGLLGEQPETVDIQNITQRLAQINQTQSLPVLKQHSIAFDQSQDICFHRKKSLPHHPNGMRFSAFDDKANQLAEATYYSIGGGFLAHTTATGELVLETDQTQLPYPFECADELLSLCQQHGLSISDIMLKNEICWQTQSDIQQQLLAIWQVMQNCVKQGCETEGVLPGGMKVKRRAAHVYEQLTQQKQSHVQDPLSTMDWINLYALAVSEENAAGSRVVTAPTNGAAGIIPAVLHYCHHFCQDTSPEKITRFLLTAGAIGILYKKNASISGADVGCQGEVGVACSMAAGGLAEFLGGTPQQVENAAEIGMEHNLGLTCDPVGGLVQIPCIERNAMGAIKAINAARLALQGDGHHFVSLDKVIKTMRDTGADMKSKYKETARGGLAVNVIAC